MLTRAQAQLQAGAVATATAHTTATKTQTAYAALIHTLCMLRLATRVATAARPDEKRE